MINGLKHLLLTSGLFLLAPALCMPAAITANGANELGNGASPGTLAVGGSVSGNYNFVYTFGDGDQYSVDTSYSAHNGPNMSFTVNGLYIGNVSKSAPTSVANDTLNVDFLQNFAYTGSATANGSASATLIESGNAPGSYSEAQLYFDGQGIGLMGPYFGPGSENVSSGPTTINSLGNPVDGDFRFTLFFAAGSAAVPEPGTASLLGFALLACAAPLIRRRFRATSK